MTQTHRAMLDKRDAAIAQEEVRAAKDIQRDTNCTWTEALQAARQLVAASYR